jgi:hypothetical protein
MPLFEFLIVNEVTLEWNEINNEGNELMEVNHQFPFIISIKNESTRR